MSIETGEGGRLGGVAEARPEAGVALARAWSVYHIDADPLWTEAVRQVLEATPDIAYLGAGDEAQRGLAEAAARQPAVVILDLSLAEGAGAAMIDALQSASRRLKIVLLSGRRDEVALFQATSGRVQGFIFKAARAWELLRTAVPVVARGGVFFPPEVRAAMAAFRASPDAFYKILTHRELSLLPFFAEGHRDTTIAGIARLSQGAVRSHRTRIMGKLGLHRTEDLMRWAWAKGFVNRPSLGGAASL